MKVRNSLQRNLRGFLFSALLRVACRGGSERWAGRARQSVTTARTVPEASCRNVLPRKRTRRVAFHRRRFSCFVYGTGAAIVVSAWTAPIGDLLRRELCKSRKRRTEAGPICEGHRTVFMSSTVSYSRRTAPRHRLGRTAVAFMTRARGTEASCKLAVETVSYTHLTLPTTPYV